jgi:hypothetical protein
MTVALVEVNLDRSSQMHCLAAASPGVGARGTPQRHYANSSEDLGCCRLVLVNWPWRP